MSCKGICIHHEAVKGVRGYRYLNGEKRCQVCCIFLVWDNDFCPGLGHAVQKVRLCGKK